MVQVKMMVIYIVYVCVYIFIFMRYAIYKLVISVFKNSDKKLT